MKTMNRTRRLLAYPSVIALIIVSTAFLAGCGKQDKNDFQTGLDAFKANQYEKAVKCFEKAADAGHAEAMFRLAQCYGKGNGVEKDEEKAFNFLKRSADAGNAKAKFMTVSKDADENVISRDEALKRLNELDADLLKLSNADDAEAQILYAMLCLMQGKRDEAKNWAEKAKANGGEEMFGI
jgi:TPR repeat protein